MRTLTIEQRTEDLRLHALYLAGDPAGTRLDWTGADLTRDNLTRANLTDANLTGAVGNMSQVRSAAFDTYSCVWTQSPEGPTLLSIGCQSHNLEKWRTADPRWIAAMATGATDWWNQYGALLLQLVDAAPATPWGKSDG